MTLLQQGYTLLREVIPLECLEAIKYELHQLIGGDGLLEAAIMAQEQASHQKLYEAQITVGSSFAAYQTLIAAGLQRHAAQALEIPGTRLHVTPLHVQVQLPESMEYSYRWHQESSFYPWAPSLLNCWFPISPSTDDETGTIAVIPRSHLKGNRKPVASNAEKFIQLVPPLECGEEAAAVDIHADPGDMLLFHADMIHCSRQNRTAEPRLTGICRVIDMSAIVPRPLYKSLSYTQ